MISNSKFQFPNPTLRKYGIQSCLLQYRNIMWEGCPQLETYNGVELAGLCQKAGTPTWIQAVEKLGDGAFPGCNGCPVPGSDY